MKSFRDVLTGVAAGDGGAPVRSFLDMVGTATAKPSVRLAPEQLAPVVEEFPAIAMPGDGADAMDPRAQDDKQYWAQKSHTEIHKHLQQAQRSLEAAHQALYILKPVNDSHETHVSAAGATVEHTQLNLKHAIAHLSRANKAGLGQ